MEMVGEGKMTEIVHMLYVIKKISLVIACQPVD